MVSSQNRVKQEQIRKRRNNLLRRHNDFWRLYAIRSWTTLEMPNGRIYTYQSHPYIPAPTDRDIVSFRLPEKRFYIDGFSGNDPNRLCTKHRRIMGLHVRPTSRYRQCRLWRSLDAKVTYGIGYQNSRTEPCRSGRGAHIDFLRSKIHLSIKGYLMACFKCSDWWQNNIGICRLLQIDLIIIKLIEISL